VTLHFGSCFPLVIFLCSVWTSLIDTKFPWLVLVSCTLDFLTHGDFSFGPRVRSSLLLRRSSRTRICVLVAAAAGRSSLFGSVWMFLTRVGQSPKFLFSSFPGFVFVGRHAARVLGLEIFLAPARFSRCCAHCSSWITPKCRSTIFSFAAQASDPCAGCLGVDLAQFALCFSSTAGSCSSLLRVLISLSASTVNERLCCSSWICSAGSCPGFVIRASSSVSCQSRFGLQRQLRLGQLLVMFWSLVPASVGTAMLRTSCENFFSTRFCCKTRLCVDYCSKVVVFLSRRFKGLSFLSFRCCFVVGFQSCTPGVR
jgi:hypothetical protein